ncbi:MAG: hypothetical protein H0W12_01575 [Chitinophagaceae bacterium]|nr:hypothetical protein [Chitinophagaceae bacterium]
MRKFIPLLFVFLSSFTFSQKYALVDTKMILPVTFTDVVTLEHSYKGYFAMERNDIHPIVAKVEEIAKKLADKKNKGQGFSYTVGNTTFTGIIIPLIKNERFDIVLTTDCGMVKTKLHLCDPKISVESNLFYINTWLKYVKSAIK